MGKMVFNYFWAHSELIGFKNACRNFSPDFRFLCYFAGLSFFLLSVFGSFGLFSSDFWTRTQLSLAYALVTFSVFGGTLFVFKKLGKEWQLTYSVTWMIVGLFIASPINLYLHDMTFGKEEWTILRLSTIGYYLFLLFILSVFSYFLIFKNSKADSIKDLKETILKVQAQNPKNNFVLPVDNFIFAKSVGNYVEINYIHQNTHQKKLVRSTMKRLVEHSKVHHNLRQCHQAFLVNLYKVETLKGKAQNRSIKLIGYMEPIPVSRRFGADIKETLNQLSLNLA